MEASNFAHTLLSEVVDCSSQCLSSASSQSPSSSKSFSDFEDQQLSPRYQPAPNLDELKVPQKILSTPKVIAAVDRHKLSSNAFDDVFAAIVRASGGNLNNFVISTSTTSRANKNVRTKMFQKAETNLKKAIKHEFVSIHCDEKLMKERGDFTPTEHIAVLCSCHNGTKLQETTTLESGTGKNQAEAT